MTKNVEELLQEVKFALMKRSPAFYYLLSYMRVVYINEYGQVADAATDGKTIYLFKEWSEYDLRHRYLIIKHELSHIFLKHPIRQLRLAMKYGGGIRQIVNLVGDGIVNVRIAKDEPGAYKYLVDYRNMIPEEKLWKKTLEELVEEFMDKLRDMAENAKCDIMTPEEAKNIDWNNVIILQEGEEDLVNAEEKEFEQKLEEYIERSVINGKNAGTGMGTIEKEIYAKLFRPQIDWVSKLLAIINAHISTTYVQTWVKVSRKGNSLPGYVSFTKPRVWVLDDDSGSIDDKQRNRFYSEMAGMLSAVDKITVIFWDDGIRDIVEFTSENDIKRYGKRFGGGTVITPVLEYLEEKADLNSWDVVVVLTDGYWFDVDKAVKILGRLSAKKILVTTGDVVEGFDEVIRLNVSGEI